MAYLQGVGIVTPQLTRGNAERCGAGYRQSNFLFGIVFVVDSRRTGSAQLRLKSFAIQIAASAPTLRERRLSTGSGINAENFYKLGDLLQVTQRQPGRLVFSR